MANKGIKGITIEFNGDTTGLGKALDGVNKKTKSLDSELKGIDRLLKFDDANPQLLAQKMEVLTSAIGETESKLDALKQAQSEVQRQFEAGEIGADQYRKFQREIIATEGRLKSLQQQQDRTKAKIEMNVDPTPLDRAKKKLSELGDESKKVGKEIGDNISKGAKVAGKGIAGLAVGLAGATVGAGAFVEANKEMAMDLARLSTNAETAGFSMGKIEEGYLKIAGVSGEMDSAVEAMSNLMATDFSEAQLAEAIEYVNGAAIKFSDTLKTEGIADGIQETFAVGEATGAMAELLERSGVDLEKFNAGLATASKNGTETDYVLQQLSQLGLASTYQAYKDNNEGLVKYNEEQGKMLIKTAELSQAMMPLAGQFLEMGNIILDMVLGNTSLTQGFGKLIEIVKNLGSSMLEAGRDLIPKFIEGSKSMIPRILDLGIELVGKLVTGIGEALPKIVQASTNMSKTLTDGLIQRLPQILEVGKKALLSLVNGITASLPVLITTGLSILMKLQQAIIANLPTIIKTAIQIITAIVTGLIQAIPKIVSFITGTMIPTMVKTITSADWKGIGVNIVKGIAGGISSMAKEAVKAIAGVVGSVTNMAKKLLKIKSPSRVFKEIGLWTGEGMAIGIDDSSPMVNKAMTNVVDGIQDVSDKFQKEFLSIQKEFGNKNVKQNEAVLKKIKDIEAKAKKEKRKLTKEENSKIAKLENDYRNGKYKDEEAFNKKYNALVVKSEKEYLDVLKKTVEDKKSLDELSLIDEAKIWEKSLELFVEGSNERITVQKEHQKAVQALNKETVALQTDITNQMLQLDKDLLKGIEDYNKEYDDAYKSRYNSFMSATGTFEEFKYEMSRTGEELMANLRSQVDGFREWQRQFDMISGRGLNQDLLDELQGMGVKALPELLALNELTDEQLSNYSNLYEEKSKLAREQTEKELEGMKKDTQKKIEELTAQSKKQLDELNKQWLESVKVLTGQTETEMLTMEQIGLNAGMGLFKGLKQMESPLQKQARQMAETITRTIQEALDIHSPSRVMKGFGLNIGQGLIIGMDDMINGVAKASGHLSSAVIGAQTSMISASKKSMANKVATQAINQNTNVTGIEQLIALMAQFIDKPLEAVVNLDGKQIANNTSKHQYNTTNTRGLMKGVNMV